MSISTRFRELGSDLETLRKGVSQRNPEAPPRAFKQMDKALGRLAEIVEVGDIPINRLEKELTPVLLAAHLDLDRGRLLLEEAQLPEEAARVWELEQRIYRLLNDL